MISGATCKETTDEAYPKSVHESLYEERQRFHRELLIGPKFCSSSAPQLRLRFTGLGY